MGDLFGKTIEAMSGATDFTGGGDTGEEVANKEQLQESASKRALGINFVGDGKSFGVGAVGDTSALGASLAEAGKVVGSALGTGIVGAGKGIAAAVDWLTSVTDAPALHKLKIAGGAYSLGTNAVTHVHPFINNIGMGNSVLQTVVGVGLGVGASEVLNSLISVTTGGLGGSTLIGSKIFQGMNAILDELKNPNVEGIPIHAVKETIMQDVEVGENIVIVQSSENKKAVVDNVVPKLRRISLAGYLMANNASGIDQWLLVKPSLMTQKRILRYYAESRKPVWLKTSDNEFIMCLITHLETARTEKALNAVEISMELQEFKVWYTEETDTSNIFGKTVGAIPEV